MPTGDYQLPDDFPDLTIPDRSEPQAKDWPPPAPSPSHPWQQGDRVLAPWEPEFLYVGVIAEIQGQQALIEFDDGDAGWVLMAQIRALSIRQGQKVFARRKMGPQFFAAEVLEMRSGDVCLGFDDRHEDEWTTVAALCIPCQAAGPAAVATQVESHLAYLDDLQEGDRVWAPWTSATLFAGTIDKIDGEAVHINFDDGDRGWVILQQLLPLEIPVGLRVMARWKRGAAYYPGTVTQVQGDDIHIQYDDGDKEWSKPAVLAICGEPNGPDAVATKINRWRGMQGWLFPILIGLLLACVRVSCR
jgi:hypothetical protein